jgi:transposase
LGTKYHVLVTADGLPLAVTVTGANRHDSMLVEPILDGLVPVKAQGRDVHGAVRSSCTQTRPRAFERVRRYLRRRGITARIARIGVDSSDRLGRHRWVVERTISWLLAFRRLAIRYDRSATTITAVATLAITIICARRLPRRDY